MRILFLCKTPYQIMVAARIKDTIYKNDVCDVIVFDTIANYKDLCTKMDKRQVFNKCFCLENTRENLSHINFFRRITLTLNYNPNIDFSEKYDEVFVANVYDWRENVVIRELRHLTSPNLKVNMYEDGFSTYSEFYGNFFVKLKTRNLIKKIYYKQIYSEYFKIHDLFVFSPTLLCWGNKYNIHEINKIEDGDMAYKNEINTIFGYNSMKDSYVQKYIFFEESYYADGIDVADVDLVEKIASVIGKKDLFIKIHPRNLVNRFKELGYITNTSTEVPWEVIAMNIDIENKILLTIASCSALSSLINFKSHPKRIIMFMNCKEFDKEKLSPVVHFFGKIAKENNGVVLLPQNINEAIDEIAKSKYNNDNVDEI